MAQYKANQEIFHVLKQGEALVGYVGIFPLKHDAIEKIMSGIPESRFRIEVLSPENIVQFKPEEAKEAFVIIGTRQRVKKSKFYATRMITGSIEFLETLERRGGIIEKVYATSRTQDGIKLSNDFRMSMLKAYEQVLKAYEQAELAYSRTTGITRYLFLTVESLSDQDRQAAIMQLIERTKHTSQILEELQAEISKLVSQLQGK